MNLFSAFYAAMLSLAFLGGPACTAEPTTSPAAPPDPVIFSFAVTGDSRQDAKATGLTSQEKIWMQHTKPLARILREVQGQHPAALFFTGDMIMGYTTNRVAAERQYAYWRGMMSALLENGIYVVPVAGNHEMQVKTPNPDGGKPLKISSRTSENLWREFMGDLILDTNQWNRDAQAPVENWDLRNAPVVGGPDHIRSDQRQLSFSFDCRKIHFAVINTSAYQNDASAPVHWLAEDLARAKARGDRNFFVFGHEMAFTYQFGKTPETEGLDRHPGNARAFWQLIADYDATYFSGHEHLYHAMQPLHAGAHQPWQIICGAAGAPFDAAPGASRNPDDRLYAYALVQVHQSGRAELNAYGFDEHYGPTKLIEKIQIQ
jgi:hypothetical protein